MQDELEDNHEDYCYILHEYWYDLLSTIEVKENRKRDITQIKRLETSKAASNYDSNEPIVVPRKKMVRTGVLTNFKQQENNILNHHGAQSYCVIIKKAGIPERKYMSHISEKCFGKRSY